MEAKIDKDEKCIKDLLIGVNQYLQTKIAVGFVPAYGSIDHDIFVKSLVLYSFYPMNL